MLDTIRYIYKDLVRAMDYLPYGLLIGIPLAVLGNLLFTGKKEKSGERSVNRVAVTCFCIYAAILLVITILSREDGVRKGMDLKLFSTWGINKRNNAFVIENILLFVPYGFLGSWAVKKLRGFWNCIFCGTVTSFGIESLQLITGRGFFQIDDILTNVLGSVIGFVFSLITFGIGRRIVEKRRNVKINKS